MITSLLIRLLPNLPAHTNRPEPTAASRANHRTRRVTSTPGRTNRQQRRRPPWPGVCPWRRTLLGQFTVRRMADRLGHRPQSTQHARPNPRRRRLVHRRVRARRRLPARGQVRETRRRHRSIQRGILLPARAILTLPEAPATAARGAAVPMITTAAAAPATPKRDLPSRARDRRIRLSRRRLVPTMRLETGLRRMSIQMQTIPKLVASP
jgi:hypothetical protein